MGVKSVIDIDVNDERFDAFLKLFQKYQAAAKRVPDDWAKQDKIVETTRRRFEKMTDEMRKQDQLVRDTSETREVAEKESVNRWTAINKQSGSILRNITSVTGQLLKWGTLTSAVGGLLGAGGLFGVSRLAGSVGAGRRSSLGFGTSYGEQRAFDINYGRLVDTGSVLSGVTDTLNNQKTRYSLISAGVSESAANSGNSVQVAKELITQMKRLADNTDPSSYQQQIDALGLANFGITAQDLNRLHGTSKDEFTDIQRRAEQDIRTMNLVEATQRAWQDLDVQLTRAASTVENSFARGLTNVIGPLEKLSDVTAKAIEAFLQSDNAKFAIEELTHGIQWLGGYLASPQFKQGAIDFATGLTELGHVIGDVYRRITGSPVPNSGSTLNELTGSFLDKNRAIAQGTFVGPLTPEERRRGENPWWLGGPLHNPGNLKIPGGVGFQHFDSDDEGLRALHQQLLRDETLHGQDTLKKLIYGSDKWPGYTTTDREAYLRNLVRGVGIAPDAQLDPTDRGQMARIMSVITKQEGGPAYPPRAVEIIIQNNTGGSAVVQTNQAAQ